MAAGVLELSDSTFQQDVLQSPVPVLVDFWATWCGPCLRVAPIVEDLAKENAGKLKIGKLDVDENPGTSSEYGVMSIPTLIVFKGGKEVDRITGALPKSAIQSVLNKHL